MADLGSDAGQGALNLSSKVLELLMKILDRLYQSWLERGRREVTKQQLAELKDSSKRREALSNLNGKSGFVNYQELKRSGMKLRSCGISMSNEEMKHFSEVCKRYGVLFSGVVDNTKTKPDGSKCFDIVIKAEDLEVVKEIANRLNTEKVIAVCDEKIQTILDKGDSMTEQDKADLLYYQQEKEKLQRGYCDTLNGEKTQDIVERTFLKDESEQLTLDEALNRLTGRSIDKDICTIVADAHDPSKYIVCKGSQDYYQGRPYIKTEYEVYRNNELVLKTNDRRFDGRPEGFWEQQKREIKQAGQFSGFFFKFFSNDEYQKWTEAVKKQNEQELSNMTKTDKEYSVVMEELQGQLDRNGATIENGVVVDKVTGKVLQDMDLLELPVDKQMLVCESVIIGEQLENYAKLEVLKPQLELAKADVEMAEIGTPEHKTATEKLEAVQTEYDKAIYKEKDLINMRKEINAGQAVEEVKNDREQARTVDLEHPDNRRGDRVDEMDKDKLTLEEAKGKIEQEKAREGAKATDQKDKSIEQGKMNPIKTSKDKDR